MDYEKQERVGSPEMGGGSSPGAAVTPAQAGQGHPGRPWQRLHRACRRVGPLIRPCLEGELSSDEASFVHRHLAGCAVCRRQAASIEGVLQATRQLAAVEPREDFMDRLRARLACEPVPRPSSWRRLSLPPSLSGRVLSLGISAAVALVLVIAGLLLTPAPQLTAEEITTRVQDSWASIRSYHCTLRTTIRYHGRTIETNREQWFTRPNRFRIESDEGQPRVTIIAGSEVVTYLPEARVVIHRPRRADEPDLPFPFRSTADLQGDITIDALLDRLRETQNAELVGREEVLGKKCYVLKFRTLKPPTRRVRRPRPFDCRLWIDGDTFLPLKMKMYYDDRTWSYTRATDLQVNKEPDPALFRLNLPEGVRWVRGDVEPRLFEVEGAALLDAVLGLERAVDALRSRASFAVLSPSWVPDGYRLIAAHARHERLRDRIERVVTLVLANDVGDAITIVQEPPSDEQKGTGDAVGAEVGYWPYPYVRLTGMRSGTSVRIMAPNVTKAEAIRLFRALQTADEVREERLRLAAAEAPSGTRGGP